MTGLAELLAENQRLREALAQRDAVIEQQRAVISERDAMLKALREATDLLEQQLEVVRLNANGPASQRYIPEATTTQQIPGDIAPPPRAPRSEEDETEETAARASGRRRRRRSVQGKRGKKPCRRNRQDFNELPSRTVRCVADPEATCVDCGGNLRVIGQAESFRINWVPGHFIVEDVVRDRCSCPRCPGAGVLTVPAPYALDRALCGDGLLARVLVDKYADHLPLNRQARRMEREGFKVGTNTMASWVKGAASLLEPVALSIQRELLAGSWLQGDDTGFPVQDGTDGKLRKGRLWAFTDQSQVFYGFTATKAGEHPTALLAGFSGEVLLVDGGSEFNEVIREQELERAGCWSHLRKYLFEARHHHPTAAALGLGTIRDLFMVERSIRGLSAEEKVQIRQERAGPLVDGLFAWLRALSGRVRPKSKLGEAVRYGLNQEAAMRVYLSNGELPMHNNLSELMLRQTVVGRKNWLFARSEGGAKAAAAIYTLVGSCMLQGVDPWVYLRDVLDRLLDHPAKRIGELTPKRWVAERSGHTELGG